MIGANDKGAAARVLPLPAFGLFDLAAGGAIVAPGAGAVRADRHARVGAALIKADPGAVGNHGPIICAHFAAVAPGKFFDFTRRQQAEAAAVRASDAASAAAAHARCAGFIFEGKA